MIRSSYHSPSQSALSKTKFMPSHHILLIKGGFHSEEGETKLNDVLENARTHLMSNPKLSIYLEIYDIDTNMIKFLFDIFRLLQQHSYQKKVAAFWIVKEDDLNMTSYINDFVELFSFPITIEIED